VTLTRAVALELYAYIQCTTPADDIEPFLAWVKSRRQQVDKRSQK